MLCMICTNELEFQFEQELGLHRACATCFCCHEQVDASLAAKQLRDGQEIHHTGCFESYELQRLQSEQTLISQADLDFLNRLNLMFSVDLDLSIETNQKIGDNQGTAFAMQWNDEKSIDRLYVTVRKMQAVTAAMSIVCGRNPHFRDAKLEISKRDNERYKAALVKRETETNNCPKCNTLLVKGICRRCTPELLPLSKKLDMTDPQQRMDAKAVESLMFIPGMTHEKALDIIRKGRQENA